MSEISRGITLLNNKIDKPVIRCIAHLINFSVKAALPKIRECVGSIRNLISFVRVSIKSRERFHELRRNLNARDVNLPSLDVVTRWQSIFHMIESALHARTILATL